MFGWFKKSSRDSDRQQRPEQVQEQELPFRPAQLPPRRSDSPTPPKPASAAVNITHDEFVLRLGGDWVCVAGSDPNQFSFESKINKTSVVLSLMSIAVPQTRLIEVAKQFAAVREQAERDSRPGQQIRFGEKWVELRPTQDVAEVAYAAFDDKLVFRFFGFVTERKVLSFWVATETRDNEFSKRVFDEVYRGLKFYVP